MNKIMFSFEVPTAYLDDFEEYQDFHLALSHLCVDNNYKDFFKSQSEKGLKAVWMDNGFNEKGTADNVHDLIWAYHETKATKIFSPDHLNWSFPEILTAYHNTTRHVKKDRVIPVLKNAQFYEMFAKQEATTVIAVPFRKRPDGIDPEWTNGQLIDLCEAEWVHYLGLNTVQELNVVRPISCDTSMPIKLAIAGKSTYEWMEKGCPQIHRKDIMSGDYFEYKMSTKEIDQAMFNINQLKEAVNG